MKAAERIWTVILGAVLSLVLFSLGFYFGRQLSETEKYRNCRAVAAIEVCAKHVGIEPKEPRHD